MTKELAIVVVHGMGAQEVGFAGPMIAEINDRVAAAGKDPEVIAWQSIYWQDILHARQERYLKEAKRKNELDAIRLRRFVVNALGDAGAYQDVTSGHHTYQRIHQRVAEGVRELGQREIQPDSTPLIVLAHSLGGHIMSNYVWDQQKHPGAGLSPFEQMKTLSGMITFGCNIPLFTFAFDEVQPIEFPPPSLPPHLHQKAKWLNFFDPDDVLGYPLKCINEAYAKVVSKDIAVNVGGILTSWNPGSHSGYWTDDDFTRLVTRYLLRFL
jgi:hypothetical protein